ncbi:hypothetical protein ACIA8R_08840 [Nonomuraea sp. NPDC051191]|uniref:hypothetical protein n=1 Tax=Nonomuraea sp. NPDC051191 TaxID=3364372 RepID=UPI00379B35D5
MVVLPLSRAGHDEMAWTPARGESGPQHVLAAVEHMADHAAALGPTTSGGRQVNGDLVDRQALTVAAAGFVKVDGAVADHGGAGAGAQARFEWIQRQGTGDLGQFREYVGGGEETREGLPHARVSTQGASRRRPRDTSAGRVEGQAEAPDGDLRRLLLQQSRSVAVAGLIARQGRGRGL